MLVTDEMVETALGILFPLNAAFNEGAHERLKAKIRSALESALSHAAGQDGEQCRAASGDVLNRIADELELLVQSPFHPTRNQCREWATALRALSRGVPEGK